MIIMILEQPTAHGSRLCQPSFQPSQVFGGFHVAVCDRRSAPPALMALTTFTTPAVVPVNTGALHRLFDIVQMMKQHGSFTETIGSDLGAAQSGPDFTTLRPEITAAAAGSSVQLGWGHYGRHLDPCGIEVDRGSGWVLPAQDSFPDTTPHRATRPSTASMTPRSASGAPRPTWSAADKTLLPCHKKGF